jgi:hypothetical protein
VLLLKFVVVEATGSEGILGGTVLFAYIVHTKYINKHIRFSAEILISSGGNGGCR